MLAAGNVAPAFHDAVRPVPRWRSQAPRDEPPSRRSAACAPGSVTRAGRAISPALGRPKTLGTLACARRRPSFSARTVSVRSRDGRPIGPMRKRTLRLRFLTRFHSSSVDQHRQVRGAGGRRADEVAGVDLVGHGNLDRERHARAG